MKKIISSKNNLLILFLFIILFNYSSQIPTNSNKNSFSKNSTNTHHSFCGLDYLKNNIFQTSPPPKKPITKKDFSPDRVFYPVRIFFDSTYMDKQVNDIEYILPIYSIIKSALDKAVKAISQIIKVERYSENIFENKLNSESITNQGIEFWDEKLNDLNYVHENYDYILFAKFFMSDNDGITAMANPFALADNTYRPLLGIINISPYMQYSDHLEQYLQYVFLHELIHAFGFLKEAFQYFPGGEAASIFTETGVIGIERTYVKTERVLNFAKKYFGCDNVKGVELENQGLEGSKNNHWDSRILLGELMTSEQYEDEGALSEFTLALLEDSGWYQVNYYSGGLMRFGKNRGCEFLNTYCLINNKTSFPNEYYDFNFTIHPTCTAGRQSRQYFFLKKYEGEYFKDDDYINILPFTDGVYIGGNVPSADYCPVSYKTLSTLENFDYFTGNCKYGNGYYGSEIRYINISTKKESYENLNGYLTEDFGEYYSNNSFCMMNTLVPDYISQDITNKLNIYGTAFHPMCFPSFCSSDTLTVQIYDQFIVCPRQGGNIKIEGYTGILHCPDYNLICTGTVMCNEIYDCIEKKSLLKEESLIYDYEPITTQRYSEINSIETILSWEKSFDGMCPGNCSQCLYYQKCRKCRNGFNLIGKKENDENPIICDDRNINIQIGYYLNNEDGVYYECHDNCLKCDKGPIDNNMNCLECKQGFVFDNSKNNCNKKKEDEEDADDSTLEIVLSVVAGTILATTSVTVTVVYVKKKKKKGQIEVDLTLSNGNKIQAEIPMNLMDTLKSEGEINVSDSSKSDNTNNKE